MRYSPINEPVWKWKRELGKPAWREQKPKVSRNCNGCSALRHRMGSPSRSRLPFLQPQVWIDTKETGSSEPRAAIQWGKASTQSLLKSALDQARCSWIWMSTVLPNQPSCMCNVFTVGASGKDRSKRVRLCVLPMTNCEVVAPIPARDGSSTGLSGKSIQEQKGDSNEKLCVTFSEIRSTTNLMCTWL